MSCRLAVLMPLPVPHAFDYAADDPLQPGTIVAAPVGASLRYGVVWDGSDAAMQGPPAPAAKIRRIEQVVDLPPLTGELRRLVDRLAAYCMTPPGMALRLVLSSPKALAPPATQRLLIRTAEAPARLTPARRRVLNAAADQAPRSLTDLARRAGVSPGVVKGLISAGTFSTIDVRRDADIPVPDPERTRPSLNQAQARAADAIVSALGRYQPFLLDGVTGSGKTEVYFEAIAQMLRRDRRAQALVLLPEIALTGQWRARFAERFGADPIFWHSDLTAGQRRDHWQAVARGAARVVVGARSALFLPFQRLSLIIVDEEHDPSFKQEDGVIYHARDMAVMRASLAKAPIILASATPSLETITNSEQGRYHRLVLPDRHGGARLPAISMVDMREDPPARGCWLSPPLLKALEATLAAGDQGLLFLNRRGYAPLTLCRHCGERIDCPHCTSWLVEHRYEHRLKCHHCGFSMPPPVACPSCGADDSLVACGPGVERLHEEVATRFPDAKIALMTSDTLHGPDQIATLVDQIASGMVDILIGTQMVAKGHHFPGLTLVGIVDADLGLKGGDLRAGERTFQQLGQVAGRAGRADRPGRVLVQTYDPDHPVGQALVAGDRDAFYAREAALRSQLGMPPFGRLVALIVTGSRLDTVEAAARRLKQVAPVGRGFEVFGPAPAPLARLRGHFRHRLLLRADKSVRVQALLADWVAAAGKLPAAVRVRIDVDPHSFL